MPGRGESRWLGLYEREPQFLTSVLFYRHGLLQSRQNAGGWQGAYGGFRPSGSRLGRFRLVWMSRRGEHGLEID